MPSVRRWGEWLRPTSYVTRCAFGKTLRAAVGMDAVLLAVPEEAVVDPYRPEVATWQGHTIRSLEAVVDLVE